MKLFIANFGRQNYALGWRSELDPKKQSKARQDVIPAGGQIELRADLNQEQIDAIVEGHKRYGLVDASKVKGPFSGLVFSVDKPVDMAAVMKAANPPPAPPKKAEAKADPKGDAKPDAKAKDDGKAKDDKGGDAKPDKK